MAGICGGVFSAHDARLESVHLAPMIQALSMGGNGCARALSFGQAAVGVQAFNGSLAGIAQLTHGEATLGLAFYGNLYNLRELGFQAREQSEIFTELLRLYLREDIAFVHKLRGEFALALWDGQKRALYLATDRFRVHPIFYFRDERKLIFASRMKAINACPVSMQRTVNPAAIVDLISHSVIRTPNTIFREIKKLPAGHVLVYQDGQVRLESYWDINFLEQDSASESELSERLKIKFAEALSIRLEIDGVSDRLGTFLSGGVDSSTVTGLLIKLARRPVKSFSIGFHEQRFNEIDYARIAAQSFGAEHYEYFASPKDAYDLMPILAEGFDEPYGNSSAIPTYLCAKMARDHGVDVLYAGDGGDELFAGNERYARERLFAYYHWMPSWISDPLVKFPVFALADRLGWPLLVKGKKYIQKASLDFGERLALSGIFGEIAMTDLLEDGLLDQVSETGYDPKQVFPSYCAQIPAHNNLDRYLYLDLKLAIADNDLFKVNRMTEAAGVQARFPFLDHELAEFAARVPAHIKMRGRKLRSFFKTAYADLLRSEIRRKKKHGFGLPIPVWLRTDRQLNEMMRDLVLSPTSVQRGYFRKRALENLVTLHRTDETSFYGTVLWHLMMLELWHRGQRN